MWQSGSLVVKKGFQLVAQVAELVDAQVSGTCGRKAVEVRVFFWAPVTGTKSSTTKIYFREMYKRDFESKK